MDALLPVYIAVATGSVPLAKKDKFFGNMTFRWYDICTMGKEIDEKKLAEAKEKLACHISPPGERKASSESSAVAGGPQTDFIDENGKVLLTRMTAAGG